MKIEIPGYKELELKYLLLDYNGTIATDGTIPDSVRERLNKVAEDLEIYVLTADTHGTAAKQCEGLKVTLKTFPVGNAADYKEQVAEELGGETCICMGNGRNDMKMFEKSVFSVAIMGTEGMYAGLLSKADICVTSIENGLDLLLYPKRIIADMRG